MGEMIGFRFFIKKSHLKIRGAFLQFQELFALG